MVLRFSCKKDGQFFVFNEEQQAQYIVTVSHSPFFSGGVYDDLGLNCLVGLKETQEGIAVSAFDSLLGLFKPQTDCLYRMQGEGWEIRGGNGKYLLFQSEIKVAEINVSDSEVMLFIENGAQAIMVIAAALVALEHNKKALGKEKAQNTPKANSKINSQRAENKEKIITINTEALKNRLSKYKLDKPVDVIIKFISSIRLRVSGKALIAMVSAIALCIALFATGLIVASAKDSTAKNVDYSNATVHLEKSGERVASFKAGEYAYSINLKGEKFKNDQKLLIYFTLNEDGTLKKYYMEKPSGDRYVTLSRIFMLLAVVIFVFMFIGNPFDRIKIKNVISKLRPAEPQNDQERIVEHEAYFSSADENSDYFVIDSDNIENK